MYLEGALLLFQKRKGVAEARIAIAGGKILRIRKVGGVLSTSKKGTRKNLR